MVKRVRRSGLAIVYGVVALVIGAGACSSSHREFPNASGGAGSSGGSGGGVFASSGASGKVGRAGADATGAKAGSDTSSMAGDANVDTGGASGAGMVGTAGASGTAAAGAAAAGASSRLDGSSCSADQECVNQHCIDGVCCETTCTGCNACARALTGKDDGKCAPVVSGQDPHSACADETATNQCGKDGECDGSGACRKVSSSHVCTPGACSADGKSFTPTSTCNANGSGSCAVSVAQDCAGYPCTASGCAKPCMMQADCGANNYCDLSTGKCAAQKPDGSTATNTYECRSGVVSDGYCCNMQCTGNCQSCKQTPGTCKLVTTPRTSCGGSGTCGTLKCDGAHADCVYPASNVACPNTCSTDLTGVMTSSCNGAGACGTASKSGCNSDQYCNAATTTCATKLATGSTTACTKDIQCQSNTCCGGRCVNTSNDKANCGSCGTACATNQSCSNGTCACTASACGGSDICNVWTFETCSVDQASWTLDTSGSNNAAYGLAVVPTKPKSGKCALKFNMQSSGATAVLDLHLCNGNGKSTVVSGIEIWMYLDGTSLSGVASKGSVSSYNNGTAVGYFSLLPYPLSTGAYQLIRGTFNQAGPVTDISIGFLAPGYAWDGIVYIDDLKVF